MAHRYRHIRIPVEAPDEYSTNYLPCNVAGRVEILMRDPVSPGDTVIVDVEDVTSGHCIVGKARVVATRWRPDETQLVTLQFEKFSNGVVFDLDEALRAGPALGFGYG